MLYIAIRAARRAGELISRSFERRDSLSIMEKNDRDFVTEVDRKAEQIIIAEIRKHYPSHGIVAEESEIINPDAETKWYIDPLDGTTNFIHGFPHFAVSIAAWRNGQPIVAVVHNPITGETFEAQNGNGAFLNRHRLRVSNVKKISHSLFASGLAPYRRGEIDTFQKRMDVCMRSADGYRRGGSAALDLAYVACGRLDAYWEAGLRPWDIAAGVILVQEAGGMATDLIGASVDLNKGNVLVANSTLHREYRMLLDI
ncbi:MAG: inositol monophosphatase family protein [Mariprofundaceae bacterium]|nr:inositol monophosphatase family protein [Mariprofundaceae bacterium]